MSRGGVWDGGRAQEMQGLFGINITMCLLSCLAVCTELGLTQYDSEIMIQKRGAVVLPLLPDHIFNLQYCRIAMCYHTSIPDIKLISGVLSSCCVCVFYCCSTGN